MERPELDRRDFARWTMAAFGGVVAGSVAGCGDQTSTAPAPTGSSSAEPEGSDTKPTTDEGGAAKTETKGEKKEEAGHNVALLMEEPHVCRGLNACMNKGATKENACAGQGACATAAHHDCHGHNDCKGQGGCGEYPGQNMCKAMGACSVPLMDKAWETARAAFEKVMKENGKEVGAAPPKKG